MKPTTVAYKEELDELLRLYGMGSINDRDDLLDKLNCIHALIEGVAQYLSSVTTRTTVGTDGDD